MGLTWEAERDQAISMQRSADRRSAAAREERQQKEIQEAIKKGVAEGIEEVLKRTNRPK